MSNIEVLKYNSFSYNGINLVAKATALNAWTTNFFLHIYNNIDYIIQN